MLDIEMLDALGQPGGRIYVGTQRRPPMLDEVFARVVADGWTPRNPADGAELDRLEAITTRGACLEPLIYAGDTVYVDRTARPQAGDIVSFVVSQRFAEAQNADLPPADARPCSPGDRWLKLYVPYHGIDLLYERYGHALAATYAACETADDTPILHPVRNVRRGGRLLFAPEMTCGQIGSFAATAVVTTTGSGVNVPNGSSYTTLAQVTVGPYYWPADIICTATGSYHFTTGANADGLQLSENITIVLGSASPNKQLRKDPNVSYQPAGQSLYATFADEWPFSLAAGATATYAIEAIAIFGQSTSACVFDTVTFKAEVIKR